MADRILHIVRWDDPTAGKWMQRTVCGRQVRAEEVAAHTDDATCPACRKWRDEYEKGEV